MNKKNILIFIATVLVAVLVFSYASAHAIPIDCKHEHTTTWWTVLDSLHKGIIKCDYCGTTIYDDSKFDPHVYTNGVCECGKTDPNYQPLNIDLDIEEPEEEPEEEPLILHEHDYKPTDIYKYVIDDDVIHAKYQYMECECGDGYLDTAEPEEHTGADTCDYCGAATDHVYVFKTRVLGISYYECTDCVAHYYRYTTDEGEVLFFDSLFDAVESKLGRELRDREWIIVNHLRETRCETF